MEGNKKILLALKDEREIDTFSEDLKKAGYEVVEVGDGARALEIIIHKLPDLVITDIDLPVIDAEKLFQIVCKNPHTSEIPFIFISSQRVDIKGFRPHVDSFLLKPVRKEELFEKVKGLLKALYYHEGSKELEGRLSQIALVDILQMLFMNKKEGELRIISGEQKGTVYLRDGQIYNAVIDGIEKEKALFRLLSWKDGRFEFLSRPIDIPQQIYPSTGNLLMEGMRQIDEFEKAKDTFPDSNAILKLMVDRSKLPKGLQPIIYEVVNLVEHSPRVGDLVDHASFPDYEVYRTIASLIKKGILKVLEAGTVRRIVSTRDFLNPQQVTDLRENLLSRFSDMADASFGKVFLVATSGGLVQEFLVHCERIPAFITDTRPPVGEHPSGEHPLGEHPLESPLGEVGRIRLYSGMDAVLFSIPTVKGMGPLYTAFSSRLIGMVLIWDREGCDFIKNLSTIKREILSRRRVPVVHLFVGEIRTDEELYESFRKELNLRMDEQLFVLDSTGRNVILNTFRTLFGQLVKEDYVV